MWSDALKKEVAYKIYKYREEFEIIGNQDGDYDHAIHFLNTWYSEYMQAGSDYIWAWCIVNVK